LSCPDEDGGVRTWLAEVVAEFGVHVGPAPVRATRLRYALGTVFAAIAWSSGTVLSDRASLDELLTYVTSGLAGPGRTPDR
jgi:hypothetical protein